MAYARYEPMIGDIRKVQSAVEILVESPSAGGR